MQKWEYLTQERVAVGDFTTYLEEKGNQGWELCVFAPHPSGEMNVYILVFKRPKR